MSEDENLLKWNKFTVVFNVLKSTNQKKPKLWCVDRIVFDSCTLFELSTQKCLTTRPGFFVENYLFSYWLLLLH